MRSKKLNSAAVLQSYNILPGGQCSRTQVNTYFLHVFKVNIKKGKKDSKFKLKFELLA